uniref:Uncharacterized protein n=1 Tax=Leersia perrieri TaxID=77586 RepID=A0A0D9WXR0_9ORYZ
MLGLPSSMRSVKILALTESCPSLVSVINILKCFPCVENLYIEKTKQHAVVLDLDRIECLDHHLKKIMLKGYRGNKIELEFAKFFVLNAKVLEVIMFRAHRNEWRINDGSYL